MRTKTYPFENVFPVLRIVHEQRYFPTCIATGREKMNLETNLLPILESIKTFSCLKRDAGAVYVLSKTS